MSVVDLYPHQRKAIKELRNGSILKGDVGTGKSRTAIAYFYSKVLGLDLDGVAKAANPFVRKPVQRVFAAGAPVGSENGDDAPPDGRRDIYVITTAKKRDDLDWEFEALDFGISTKRELSSTGVRLVVDSWNNIANYAEVKDAFFIFDEQRLVGSGSWVKAFYKIAKANQWIVLSATPGDNWMDYIPVFVANGWYKNRTEFVRRHVVFKSYSKFPKVDRYLEEARLVRMRDYVLVEMPYLRHTVRHDVPTLCDYDQDIFKRVWKDRWHVYEERPLRDVAEMFNVARKVVNSDFSRIEEVIKIQAVKKRLIVFYNFDYELMMLREVLGTIGSKTSTSATTDQHSSLTPGGQTSAKTTLPETSSLKRPTSTKKDSTSSGELTIAEWNGHKHEPVPETDEWIYLVQYTAGAEGWNCIATDAELFYSKNYSYKINEQAKGRIDRLNTPYTDLYYYLLYSDSEMDRAIDKSLATKKNFNEKDYMRELELAA